MLKVPLQQKPDCPRLILILYFFSSIKWKNFRVEQLVSPSKSEDHVYAPLDNSASLSALSWQSHIDLCVAIGGDGTLLYLSSLFPDHCPPVIPFFSGSLGFLLPFDPDQYDQVLDVCLVGKQPLLLRHRLEFCTSTEKEWFQFNGPGPETSWSLLLNEV